MDLNPERIYKNEDIFFAPKSLNADELAAQTQAEKEGKLIIRYCCNDTLETYHELAKVGLTIEEWEIFRKCLFNHPYDHVAKWYKKEGIGRLKTEILDGKELCEELIDYANLLEKREIRILLIKKVGESILHSNRKPLDFKLKAKRVVTLLEDTFMNSSGKLSIINPIQWNGTQGELAELFIELRKKGWIGKPDNRTVRNCFSNANSIDQYFRPAQDKKTYTNTYEKVYTPLYKPKFHGILSNPKKGKK